ncbi:putative ERF1 domain 2 protein [Nitrosotalea sinensis]|jgi:peptide chain release factor subunit 1|uniref:Peptide chain release factor subunit 1 n=1 Tax=Nitrosotalea sinensis TaxID=1499975 RepID=A0A2H1EHH4_9ARCH|nr:peptide chain release factor aRF-1 [Candidatus Nitrosotalea sinensis]SHO46472.1 putative ERF1 domain 2 protein [Candidatus Nitrosotalea sinensis]
MVKPKIEKQDSVKLYKLRKMLEELSDHSGRGTELITLYVPPKKALHEVINNLREEQGTADNIKSDLTRTHVVDALSRVIQRLKLYKSTPDKGLVMFCGALPPPGGGPIGSEVIKLFEIEPPKELQTFLYRCDDHFHVDILKDMLKDDNMIGFLALDAKDAGWGLLRGDKLDVLSETSSGVAGKHRQGGQSARRFERLREMELNEYYNRVAHTTREYFIDIYPVKGLIVSGPGPTKENFLKENYLEYRLQNNVLATLDCSYAGAEGVREAFTKAHDILNDYRMVEEKKLVDKLFSDIHFSRGLAIYGLNDIIDLLKRNVVQTVLITDDTNLRKIDITCKRCQNVQTEILDRAKVIPRIQELLSKPCPSCKSMDLESSERDIVDYLDLLAGQAGAKVEVITGATEYGTMLSSIGKVGAFLRYNPNQ